MYVVYSDICTCGYLHVCSFGVYILIRIHYADLENISAYALREAFKNVLGEFVR